MSRADALAAEGHELIARGHAKLAEAARLRAEQPAADAARESWIPPGSILPKREELRLARAGVVESSKIGRRVLVRRSSLEGYVASHKRGERREQAEDLFA